MLSSRKSILEDKTFDKPHYRVRDSSNWQNNWGQDNDGSFDAVQNNENYGQQKMMGVTGVMDAHTYPWAEVAQLQ